MRSTLLALSALAFLIQTRGQTCFRVVDSGTGSGLENCHVRCLQGDGTWLSDATGRVCLGAPCDSVRIERTGLMPRTVTVSELEITGLVRMEQVLSELNTVVIEHWPRKRDRQALAAFATVDSASIAGFERSSLRSAAQWIPGVQWDERGHGGSTRLSIRGSVLRSPYGVRGAKTYWGPFPLTLADGSTPLEVMDPILVGGMTISRSVGSPIYGCAPSGLVLGQAPVRNTPGSDAALEATGGSYGYYRLGALARLNKGASTFTTGIVHQRNNGYREQESSGRDQAFVATTFAWRKSVTRAYLTWQKADWDLPGSLDKQTAENDPQAARPYSVLVDAHVEKEQAMGGVANELMIGEHLALRTGIHGQMIDKINPYGTSAANCGYKEESIRAVGGRLSLGADQLAALPVAWDLGLELLGERDHLRELTYVNAVPGDIKVNGDTRVTNLNSFLTTATRLGRSTTLHAGAGMERTEYDHEDHVAGTVNTRRTTPRILPYAGIEQDLKAGYRMHVRYAESISRATVWELLGSSGGFNTSLQGEQVREWEFGASHAPAETDLRADLNIFHRAIDDLITEIQEGDGGTHFENQEQALITGCEVLVQGPVHKAGPQRIDLLASVAITATDLTVDDPNTGERSLGDIPGVPVLTGGLIARTQGIGLKRLALEAGIRIIGIMQTGGATTDNEHIEHVRASYTIGPPGAGLQFFLHCENLLDARYSSWIQVNDPGMRYYNPAPGRSFFAGIRLTIGSSPPPSAD